MKEIIIGRNPVKEALKAKRVLKVYISQGFSDRNLLNLLAESFVPKVVKTNNEINALANGGVHQGIVAEIKPYEYVSLDYLLHQCKGEQNPTLVMLDGINDPHNMGTVLRNCDIFGVKGVIISKHNQVPLNSTVAKTSAGAINYVPVALVSNLNQAIATLKENGFWILSADGSGKTSYLDLKYDFPTVLVIGSEGNGIAPLILKNSDYIVKIPMYGKVNSLNASVASGILLAKIKEV